MTELKVLGDVRPIRIVVIDDHQVLRDCLLCRLQQESDLEVVGLVGNSPEAYDCIEKNRPSVVIMDLNLSGVRDFAAIAHIRRQYPQIKILILTGGTLGTAAEDAMSAGANGFLWKSDSSDELVRAVRVVMSGKTYLSADAATAVTQALLKKSARDCVLSERELTVLKNMADGLTYKEIAGRLDVSAKSIETYRARLVKKTGCATLAALVRYAVREGIIVP